MAEKRTWFVGRILNVDAQHDGEGWYENQAYVVARDVEIPMLGTDLAVARRVCKYLREAGLLSNYSSGRVVVDHGHCYVDPCIVVCDRGTFRPLFRLDGEWVER